MRELIEGQPVLVVVDIQGGEGNDQSDMPLMDGYNERLSGAPGLIAKARECMAEASRIILKGFEVRTDVKVVRWPDRYMDPRGRVMWERVMKLIGEGNAN